MTDTPDNTNPYVWWAATDGSHGSCYKNELVVIEADAIPESVKELIDLAANEDDMDRVWDLMFRAQEGIQEGTS